MAATTWTFAAAVSLYLAAAACFFGQLLRGGERLAFWATLVLTAAVVAHGAFIGAILTVEGYALFQSLLSTLALGSLLVVVVYLGTMRRHRLTVLGAFITPITLLMLLGAGLETQVARVSNEMRSALLPFHILVNTLGIVAFALAFAVAVAYMIQEQRLRRRELTGVFQRLPPLDVLDSLGLRLTTIGFPLLTIGMLTGSLWAIRSGHGTVEFSPGQGFAVLSWLFFAIVLLFRAAAGWRGRRAAVGTVLGFVCAMAALVGYAVRGLGAT